MSNHIYFCEIVYLRSFFKQKQMSIWPMLYVLKLITKDNFALNKDEIKCSVKISKAIYFTSKIL